MDTVHLAMWADASGICDAQSDDVAEKLDFRPTSIMLIEDERFQYLYYKSGKRECF